MFFLSSPLNSSLLTFQLPSVVSATTSSPRTERSVPSSPRPVTTSSPISSPSAPSLPPRTLPLAPPPTRSSLTTLDAPSSPVRLKQISYSSLPCYSALTLQVPLSSKPRTSSAVASASSTLTASKPSTTSPPPVSLMKPGSANTLPDPSSPPSAWPSGPPSSKFLLFSVSLHYCFPSHPGLTMCFVYSLI